MLKLNVVLSELFDEEKEEFVTNEFVLELEHSLVSLSKWESEHKKPFLGDNEKTNEEVFGYVKHMILTPEFPPEVFTHLTNEHARQIQEYIENSMTATWFTEPKKAPRNTQKITSELIYYWMTSYQIPWEAQYWHLNRLFTLIKVFNAQNEPAKKKSPGELAAERQAINEERKRKYNTSG